MSGYKLDDYLSAWDMPLKKTALTYCQLQRLLMVRDGENDITNICEYGIYDSEAVL